MREKIEKELQKIEAEHGVKIILAVESGSRAWGFASPDSDYDVRFIYLRKKEYYLRLNPVRDVIELPIDEELDINGWDLQKMLRLLYRSNPTVFEWFSSPIVYRKTDLAEELKEVMKLYFSKKKTLYHYLSMAENNYRGYLRQDMVRAKKYFYVLRPVLAAKWIFDYGTPPPMEFSQLVKAELPAELIEEVKDLLDIKINCPEVKNVPRRDAINKYLEKSIAELREQIDAIKEDNQNSWDKLNEIFLNSLE